MVRSVTSSGDFWKHTYVGWWGRGWGEDVSCEYSFQPWFGYRDLNLERGGRETQIGKFPGSGHPQNLWLSGVTGLIEYDRGGAGESPSFRGGRVSHVEFTIYLSTLKNKHFFVLASFPALQTEATLSLPSCLFIFRESVSFSGFRVPAVVQVADLISNPRQSMDIVIYSFNRERLNVPLRQTQFRFWESDSEEDRQAVYP